MNRPAFFYKASFPGRQYLGYSHLEANPTTFFFQIIATLLAGRLKSRFTWFAHVVIFRLVDFFRDRNKEMNAHLPFAVVGSNDFVKVGSKSVRARQYPWGVVQGIIHHFLLQAFLFNTTCVKRRNCSPEVEFWVFPFTFGLLGFCAS